ncbi:MAG: hypothetical protein M1812_002432 [Candelaria pacifica]|nr:MAG: hypothetical protein M1812_002432 [Candelaria pacifica]
MTRRSLRQQAASTSSTPKKRASSPADVIPSRQSKRAKAEGDASETPKSTPKKSQYFKTMSEVLSDTTPASDTEIANEESGYSDEDEAASLMSTPPDTEEEEEEDDYSGGHTGSTKRSGGTGTGTKATVTKGQELWRPGVKSGLAPGQELLIKLPKARGAGKTPYEDDMIHPNTMLFLKDLKANNDREWLKTHDADYRASQNDFNTFVECMTSEIIERDETIPELPPKDLIFRIYRDIRFSPDPTPYKTHFSAAWSRTGRKGPYAGYYVQIKPGGSFVGGGLWMPEAQPLALLRGDVDRQSDRIKTVLSSPGLRREFFGGISNDPKKVIKAFVGSNSENALKTKPKVCPPFSGVPKAGATFSMASPPYCGLSYCFWPKVSAQSPLRGSRLDFQPLSPWPCSWVLSETREIEGALHSLEKAC